MTDNGKGGRGFILVTTGSLRRKTAVTSNVLVVLFGRWASLWGGFGSLSPGTVCDNAARVVEKVSYTSGPSVHGRGRMRT